MGNSCSSPVPLKAISRTMGITGGAAAPARRSLPKLPANAVKTSPEDYVLVEGALSKLLLFARLDSTLQRKIVAEMYERTVTAGEILIKEGDTGHSATELFVVKSGKFEVLQKLNGQSIRVNMKDHLDCFGEVSLMYDSPRSATVAATTDAQVWVLDRQTFRFFVRNEQEAAISQVELFINSVPILASLTREERLRLVDALEESVYPAGSRVVQEGDKGNTFFIIKEGEATVYQQGKKVNHLFKGDFFGERALLKEEPRIATVEATSRLVCLTLQRDTFKEMLGSLEEMMNREKSALVVEQRMTRLKLNTSKIRQPAVVLVKRKKAGRQGEWETVRAKGHLDEVLEMSKGGTKLADMASGAEALMLTEKTVLGTGAFSHVSIAVEETTGREFALKRMRKTGLVQCPEHVYCEQSITKNITHPFCIRQYASFQDKYHLYFLFDLMSGGDLMDVLVAEAKVVKHRMPQGALQRGMLAPMTKILQGVSEDLGRFYIGSLVLALDYLHNNNVVYRDLKPENVFVDANGYPKLGDFGFAKELDVNGRTYTFCGTPGYVAPENVLAHGYNYSVDWWGLGVVMYVMLTGKQPFSFPSTDDPMVVMRRIVDENYTIRFPPYMSPAAKDLILKLLERKPTRRLGMMQGRADDIKKHKWFEGFKWVELEARRMPAPRVPKMADTAKRLHELAEEDRRTGAQQPREHPAVLEECERVFADF